MQKEVVHLALLLLLRGGSAAFSVFSFAVLLANFVGILLVFGLGGTSPSLTFS